MKDRARLDPLHRTALAPALALALALAGALAGGRPAAADEPPLPLGGEILIPDVTAGEQLAPEVASNEDGDFVAVWQSLDEDGDGFGILAQRFDFDGGEVGTPLAINLTATGDQTHPAIACDDSGDFAIAWQGPDGSGTGIFARLYEEDGLPESGEVAVNATTAGAQALPSVALSESGDFLVVWQGPDASGLGIFARLFDDHGAPLTGEIQVNTTTAGNQQNPQVRAYDETGGYVVVWEGPDASGSGIFLRRMTAAGGFVAGEAAVNDVTSGSQRNPAIAITGLDADPLDRNLFVVVWQSPDSHGNGIYARLYDDDGAALALQQLVSEDNADDQIDPSVAVDDGGDPDGSDFVVTWTEAPILGAEGIDPLLGAPIFIRGRRLAGAPPTVAPPFAGGLPAAAPPEGSAASLLGVESALFSVSIAGSATAASSVATEDNGDFVVVWQSDGQDGSDNGVYGRRFAGQPIFVDGFESGDTGEWSLTVP